MIDDAPVPTLVPAFDAVVELGTLLDLGATRAGHRRVIPIVGGRLSGGLDAEILAGGGDWQTVRADGALEIDGRYSARTAEGHLLSLTVRGVRSGPPEVLAALLEGRPVPADRYYFRTAISIETSAAALRDLEHLLFVAACVRDANTVRYTAYRVG